MKNLWKEKIDNNEKTVGMFVNIGNESAMEVAAMSSMDYVIIDTEHGPFDVESTAAMIRAIELHHGTTLVRVKDSNRNSILKMLDVGGDCHPPGPQRGAGPADCCIRQVLSGGQEGVCLRPGCRLRPRRPRQSRHEYIYGHLQPRVFAHSPV